MRDLIKRHPIATVKTLSDADAPGTFEALVSVFGNVDSDGDIVASGAFTKTLAAGPKPIVYSHDWFSVPIGQTIEATETDEGLLVKARLFVADDEDHPEARKVYAAMRGGALTEFSWGGRVVEETRREDDDGDVTYVLQEIDLVEYGPCLKGANSQTRLLAVKSAAGRLAELARGGNVDDATESDRELAKALRDELVRPAEPDEDADVKNLLTLDDVDRLRGLLQLPADADTATVLGALRAEPATDPAGRAALIDLLLA